MTARRMTPGEVIASVRRAAAIVANAGEAQVGDALAIFAAHGTPLDQGLGLAPDWHRVILRRRRDELLAEAAGHFPTLRGRKQAGAIATALDRYRAGAWSRDREAAVRPSGAAGIWFELCEIGEIPGAERIYQIVRNFGCNHEAGDYTLDRGNVSA